jgi:hypothetical protein
LSEADARLYLEKQKRILPPESKHAATGQ